MTEDEIARRLSGCAAGGAGGTFAAGTEFGDWRLTAFIAKGGMAEVYCAEHKTLGTAAAVKVLSEPLTDSRRARFRREARILAELKERSFPAFYAYGEAAGRPYLAEELLEPGELPSGDGARAKYLLALCGGLKSLHARGVVHRDLKPANILFRGNGEPVIVDLGLAKSVSAPVVPDGVSIVDGRAVGVGTPEYAAPEQFTGGDITPAADVHALGVLAEKLLESGGGGASCWRRIIRRATSSIAAERYQSVGALAAAIRRRHWLRNGVVGGCALVVVGLLIGLTVAFSEPTFPGVVELRGRTVVIKEPLVLKPGRTYRVIGPGTLDADLSGGESTVLWMTNCVVLNRSRLLPPKNKLHYELTKGVYLNLIGAEGRPPSGRDYRRYYKVNDGAYNDVRFRGPETISGLMRLREREMVDLMGEDL